MSAEEIRRLLMFRNTQMSIDWIIRHLVTNTWKIMNYSACMTPLNLRSFYSDTNKKK